MARSQRRRKNKTLIINTRRVSRKDTKNIYQFELSMRFCGFHNLWAVEGKTKIVDFQISWWENSLFWVQLLEGFCFQRKLCEKMRKTDKKNEQYLIERMTNASTIFCSTFFLSIICAPFAMKHQRNKNINPWRDIIRGCFSQPFYTISNFCLKLKNVTRNEGWRKCSFN